MPFARLSTCRTLLARSGLVAILALAVSLGAAQTPQCRITAPRPARTFYPGENVVLTLTAGGAARTLQYVVTDYYSAPVGTGEVVVGADQPRPLNLGPAWPLGIYHVSLRMMGLELQRDAFCVIPRPDSLAGDSRLFSWHFSGDDPQVWCALAQVGARLVRRDLGWPQLMPEPGRVDLGLARSLVAQAQAYGMQLIPIIGYSPGWAGVKPANAYGRSVGASHTWAPATTTGWRETLAATADYLAPQRLTWPSPRAISPQQVGHQDSLPVVHSWEIWNEADQNFYYGYWPRYVDLLRIAHGEIKRRDPWATVLYGGSCGHWTELGHTYALRGQYFFDALAFHPGGVDMDHAFQVYWSGAPQIGNGYGLFHPATITEAYPETPAGLTPAQYMLRLHTVLAKWPMGAFCSFDAGTVVGAADPASNSLLWWQGADLLPNARYVALAVTRWLLSSATYVGPVRLGEGVEAHMFLRTGRPLLVCWAAAETPVTLRVCLGAYLVDEMGQHLPLEVTGGQASFTLGSVPRAVCGADRAYLAQALSNQAEIVLTTPQGYETQINFGYISALQSDAAWAGAGWPQQFRDLLSQGLAAMANQPRTASNALGLAQVEINAQIARTIRKCSPGEFGGRVPSVLWRLESFSECLGSVIDAYNERWGGPLMAPQAVADLQQAIEQQRLLSANPSTGMTQPLGFQALQRAHRLAERAAVTRGIGTFRAARGEWRAAVLCLKVEYRVMTGVVAVADFPTATQVLRGAVFAVDRTHQLNAFVYNFTDREVRGKLTWTFDTSWGALPVTLPFVAPPGGYVGPLAASVAIPGGPNPVLKPAFAPGYDYQMLVPEQLAPEATLELSGQLEDRRRLLTINYPVLVGELQM